MYIDDGSMVDNIPGVDLVTAYGSKCAVDSPKVSVVPRVLIPVYVVVLPIKGGRATGGGFSRVEVHQGAARIRQCLK